ncbi:S-layer homology domain-containing protein [Propionigenium maris]|nr:S-layer homology domain-containing protein [Propionigenium maris]
MKRILVIFLILSSTIFSEVSFKDVNKEHWAYRSIDNLIEKDIWMENSDIFQGKKEVTRYEFAYYLSKTLNKLDTEKASRGDLVILENLVYEFAKELNKFGFDTDLYLSKVKGMEDTLEILKGQVEENQRVIQELQKRIDKLEKK